MYKINCQLKGHQLIVTRGDERESRESHPGGETTCH